MGKVSTTYYMFCSMCKYPEADSKGIRVLEHNNTVLLKADFDDKRESLNSQLKALKDQAPANRKDFYNELTREELQVYLDAESDYQEENSHICG